MWSSDFVDALVKVTPYAGVWIEIIYTHCEPHFEESLPTRECGLKSIIDVVSSHNFVSLPTRECGLK